MRRVGRDEQSQIGVLMLVFLSILAAAAVLSQPGGLGRGHEDVVLAAPVARVSMPDVRDQAVRISMPSELFRGVITNQPANCTPIVGAIVVPANARAGIESATASAAAAAYEEARRHPELSDRVFYGAHGVRRTGYATGSGGRRVLGRNATGHGSTVFAGDGSIFNDTADDAHRRAQLRFYEASYPRLGTFEDAHRRAQLEFHRATLTPGSRGADGLRRESGALRGPGLRRSQRSW